MVYYGDQSNTTFLSHFLERSGGNFDVIIDDGSHLPSHQVISFEALWKSVVPGGQYIVEDTETSYWKVRFTKHATISKILTIYVLEYNIKIKINLEY